MTEGRTLDMTEGRTLDMTSEGLHNSGEAI